MLIALALSALLAADAAPDVIRTKDAATRVGRILSETNQGYLFRDEGGATYVIAFDTIDDVQRGSDAPRVVAPPPVPPSVVDYTQRTGRAFQLQQEIYELHAELEDATLGGPVFKLVSATLAAGLSLGALSVSSTSRSNDASTYAGVAVGAGIVAVVLFVWGGIQLRNRIHARTSIPEEIASREDQIELMTGTRVTQLAR